jgi:hypothetical protein
MNLYEHLAHHGSPAEIINGFNTLVSQRERLQEQITCMLKKRAFTTIQLSESESVTALADQLVRLREQRNEARDIVRRALELASPVLHPEQWIGYRAVCLKADDRWEDNDR